MSVTAILRLPDQPASGGSVSLYPLGGDGKTSPFACYHITNFQLTHDVTGGFARFQIWNDPKFACIWQHANCSIDQAVAADALVRWSLTPAMTQSDHQLAGDKNVSDRTIDSMWFPPGLIHPAGVDTAVLQCRMLNVDGSTAYFSGQVFLFDSNVRQLAPIGDLMRNRGSSPSLSA